MDTFLYVSASVALLALAGLFLYMIVFFRSTKGLVDNASKTVATLVDEVKAVRLSLDGTIQNVQAITGQLEGTVGRVNDQLGQIDGLLGSVRQMSVDAARIVTDGADVVDAAKGVVMSVIKLEQDIQEKVQLPIMESMTVFTALGKGIRAFRNRLGNGSSSNGHVTAADIYYERPRT